MNQEQKAGEAPGSEVAREAEPGRYHAQSVSSVDDRAVCWDPGSEIRGVQRESSGDVSKDRW